MIVATNLAITFQQLNLTVTKTANALTQNQYNNCFSNDYPETLKLAGDPSSDGVTIKMR